MVMVLATDLASSKDKKAAAYLEKIISNREEYARHHGYELAVKHLPDKVITQTQSVLHGWHKLALLRRVIEEHPNSEWFWFLDQNALIMDPQVSLIKDILGDLESTMLRDIPVVPPESVIRTLKTGEANNVQFVLSHDQAGLNTNSFLLRNGDWAKYFLEAWTEPVRIETLFDCRMLKF